MTTTTKPFTASEITYSQQTPLPKPPKPPHPRDAFKHSPASATRAAPMSRSLLTAASSNSAPPPDSIAELARALKHDVDLIYEWVYSNVDAQPMWGSHKGAFGTQIDRAGGCFEQAALMVALLRESGYKAKFIAGSIRLTKAQVENWLGTNSSTVLDATQQVLDWAQIPYNATIDGASVLEHIDIAHIWVQAEIDGTEYVFDPTFKTYSYKTPVDLGPVLNFDESALVTNAQVGATVTPDYITDFNTANVQNDIAAYSTTLLNWIRQNRFDASTADIVGGRSIVQLPIGTRIRQTTLPNQAPGIPINIWDEIPDTYRGSYEVYFNDANDILYVEAVLFTDTIYGRRLTLGYSPDNRPELRLDGTLLALSDIAAAPSGFYKLTFYVYHPFNFGNAAWAQFVSGEGVYVLGNCWGGTSQAMVDHHRRLLKEYTAAGASSSEEQTLGQSLLVYYLMHHAQSNALESIYGGLFNTTQIWYHFCGITGYSAERQSPYFDLAGVGGKTVSLAGDQDTADKVHAALGYMHNAFEAGILQQSLPITGINTERMLEVANAEHQEIYDVTGENWTIGAAIRDILAANNWGPGSLDSIETSILNGFRIIVHKNGHTLVGQYQGGGWHELRGSTVNGLLTGGKQGGDTSNPVGKGQTTDGGKNGEPGTDTGSKGRGGEDTSNEPIGLFSGDYIYDRADMTVGSGGFPYALQFSRHYKSSNRFDDGPLGLGWTHNFATSLSVRSNALRAIGEVSPKEGALVIAHSYILAQMALHDDPSLVKVLIASLSSIWLMDQMTNNAITVDDISESRSFIKLIDDTYQAAPGYADTLTINLDGSYIVKNPQKETWNFDSAGKMTSHVSPASVTRTYSYDANDHLLSVSTGMGRTLTFIYTGDRLTSVADNSTPVRTISFTFDADGNHTGFTDTLGNTIQYQYTRPGLLEQIYLPANPNVPVVTNYYDSLGRVKVQKGATTGLYEYFFAGCRSEEVDPAGNSHVQYYSNIGSVEIDIDALGNITTYERDGLNRLISVVMPEGNSIECTYDQNNNVLTKTWVAKPGSGIADVTHTFTYDPHWNRVASFTDGRGNTTGYQYIQVADPEPAKGRLKTITRPTVGGQTPTVNFTYTARGQMDTRTDETGIVDKFVYDSGTEVLLSSTHDFGTGRLNLTTSFGYNTTGDATTFTDARSHTITRALDSERRLTQVTSRLGFVTNYVRNKNGWVTMLKQQSDPANTWQTFKYVFDASSKLLQDVDPAGRVRSYVYDYNGRLVSKIDAEQRQWRFFYDPLSRVSEVIDPNNYLVESRSYSENGRLLRTVDANSNATDFQWDGMDRMEQRTYADGSFDAWTYDPNSNVLTQTTRKGDVITQTFDELNRLSTRAPGPLPLQTVTYDLSGRPSVVNTPVVAGDPTSGDYKFFYDSAGRLTTQRTPTNEDVVAEFDANGNRTKLTWPDGYFVQYVWDDMDRLTDIKLNGDTHSAVQFVYDKLSRRSSVSFSNGTSAQYSFWLNNDLNAHSLNFDGSAAAFTFAYNRVHQLTGLSASDPDFIWTPQTPELDVYGAASNLNEYPSVNWPLQYDANGCLTSDGTRSFSYDSLNRLTQAVKGSMTVTYLNDPLNRQARKTATQLPTVVESNYLFDFNSIIAEKDGSGTLVARYVYGAPNEPLVRVDNAGGLKFLHTDRLNSVIGTTDDTGAITTKVAYSPTGESATVADNLFGFTGHKYEPEVGLYNYKARYYDPALGRFLQPDPMGYLGGDLNLYTYAGNDPVNLSDSSGMFATPGGTNLYAGAQQMFTDFANAIGNIVKDVVGGGGPQGTDEPPVGRPPRGPSEPPLGGCLGPNGTPHESPPCGTGTTGPQPGPGKLGPEDLCGIDFPGILGGGGNIVLNTGEGSSGSTNTEPQGPWSPIDPVNHPGGPIPTNPQDSPPNPNYNNPRGGLENGGQVPSPSQLYENRGVEAFRHYLELLWDYLEN